MAMAASPSAVGGSVAETVQVDQVPFFKQAGGMQWYVAGN